MGESRPISIRATVWLAIALTLASTLLGAGALHSYDLYRRAHADGALRARTLAEAYASWAAAWLPGPRAELSGHIAALPWHPDACLLAVLTPADRDGREAKGEEILGLRGDRRLLDRFLRESGQTGETVLRIPLGASPDGRHGWPDLYLASTAVRAAGSQQAAGRLIVGVRATTRSVLTSRQVTIFFLRLLLIAVTGGFMGFWYLKRTVIQPLAVLARESGRMGEDQMLARQACGRDDEIGEVARALAEMHISLDEWRERAARLERNISRRVASETQRVSRELQEARRAVWTDPLTRLGNRKALEDRFADIYAAQIGAGSELCVVMLDVDNFKKLNDTKGHAAGDELLRFIGELLRQSLREGDLAIRYGGDEFILILPSVPLKDARSIAQRTILLFNQQARLLSVEPRPGLSAGVASVWEHKSQSPEHLLQLADQALYEAKRAGKACVKVAQPGKATHQPIRRSLQLT